MSNPEVPHALQAVRIGSASVRTLHIFSTDSKNKSDVLQQNMGWPSDTTWKRTVNSQPRAIISNARQPTALCEDSAYGRIGPHTVPVLEQKLTNVSA